MATNSLPREVIHCLRNARYLHLATSDGLWPHVSLMNYTYLPSSPYLLPPLPQNSSGNGDTSSTAEDESSTGGPLIIMTTQASTKKTLNLMSNPRVSLLVHDWVSHRQNSTSLDPTSSITNPTMDEERAQEREQQEQRRRSSGAIPQETHQSSLAMLLANLNSAELSSISATLNGYAHLIPQGTEEEEFYKRAHLENNPQAENRCYVAAEELRVVVVRIGWARVADFRGGVRDFECSSNAQGRSGTFGAGMPNGL